MATVKALLIGGGGAGGDANQKYGGGGGAGGYVYNAALTVAEQAYDVRVGGRGQAATPGFGAPGNNGGDSTFAGLVAPGGGGGGGGSNNTDIDFRRGYDGGCGGGGGNTGAGGGIAGLGGGGSDGGDGGDGNVTGTSAGGGGGGTSANGADASTNVGGNGGNGTANSISGSSITYGGGGGGSGPTNGNGGTGGGGNATGSVGQDGTNGLGGGGGSGTSGGGRGGSGVVIISYKADGTDGISTTSTGGTITQSGGYQIHTFTSNGTFNCIFSTHTVVASVGAFILTGIAATLIKGGILLAEVGEFIVNGFDAIMTATTRRKNQFKHPATFSPGTIKTAIINNGGSGYTIGDQLTVDGGNGDGVLSVDDVTDIVVPQEFITNGDFNGNANGWTLEYSGGEGWYYDSNRVTFGSSTQNRAYQTTNLVPGDYTLTFDLDVTDLTLITFLEVRLYKTNLTDIQQIYTFSLSTETKTINIVTGDFNGEDGVLMFVADAGGFPHITNVSLLGGASAGGEITAISIINRGSGYEDTTYDLLDGIGSGATADITTEDGSIWINQDKS